MSNEAFIGIHTFAQSGMPINRSWQVSIRSSTGSVRHTSRCYITCSSTSGEYALKRRAFVLSGLASVAYAAVPANLRITAVKVIVTKPCSGSACELRPGQDRDQSGWSVGVGDCTCTGSELGVAKAGSVMLPIGFLKFSRALSRKPTCSVSNISKAGYDPTALVDSSKRSRRLKDEAIGSSQGLLDSSWFGFPDRTPF